MRIGILGSGLMGGKLGTICARLGHHVVFSYARTPKKLEKLAREAGGHAHAGTPADAVRDADALILAVHWTRVDDVLKKAGKLSGKIVITCSMPMSRDDSRLVIGHTSSGAEALAKKARGAQVVSAFGTVPSEVLFPVFERRGTMTPPDLLFCGGNTRAKQTVSSMIREIGFTPIDLGDLTAARYMEPFCLLVARMAYGRARGAELAYRFERVPARTH